RLGGVASGSVLRPVPGGREVALDVDVQGTEGEVWWMLDGRVVGHGASGHPFKLVLAMDGRYTLTVMDAQGRHDRVVFEISGVTP
ncbi:penicillin-binding protein 1C, partial [Achromobacter xylosoxidans]